MTGESELIEYHDTDDEEDIIEEEPDSVLLIASGYEWTCPNCDIWNKEIEIQQEVTCPTCNRTYSVEGADHAWE